MAGHSQFKNIMHRKGAQDAKRAKVFTKIIRELTVSAREGGSDPSTNPRLRSAMINARTSNLPKETLERAVKRGAGGEDTTNYAAVRYEGYGPAGVAIIVEALTDNRNRTAPEVRAAFNKYGGTLGETNSVSFMFDHIGVIQFPAAAGSSDAFFEAAIESGAQNVDSTGEGHEVTCSLEAFCEVRDALIKIFGDPLSAQLSWRPKTTAAVPDAQVETLMKLIDILEDNDDVQHVFANFEISDTLAAKLCAS